MSHTPSRPCRTEERIAFPVRCVAEYDDLRNRWRSRWGEPRRLGAAAWPGSAPKGSAASVRLTAALCREAWDGIVAPEGTRVIWVADAPSLVAVDADGIEVAVDAAEAVGLTWSSRRIEGAEIVQRGFVALLRMAGRFAVIMRAGNGVTRAYDAALAAWDALADDERHAVLALLDSPQIDSGHIFGRFLRIVTDDARRAAAGETTEAWRRRWTTWLLGQARVDLPYDRDAVDAILRAHIDADDARIALYQAVRDYDRTAEAANAARVACEVAWAKEELIFGRMSRAFHNQALLFAHARYVAITDEMDLAARAVAEAALPWPEIRPAVDRLHLLVRPGDEAPLAELAGALDHLEEQALRGQRARAQGTLADRRAQVEAAEPDPDADGRATRELEATMRGAEAILRAAGSLRQRILEAPRRPAAYLVMSQRPSPTGSHLLAKINEGEEPYPGKPEDLRQLVALAGDRVYASPDYVWLEHAAHWIEAIPLFIKERIRVVNGVETAETVIDQEGMEESFREQMADPWARNLRATELSGWCALARAMLAEDDPAREGSLGAADLSCEADLLRARVFLGEGRTDDIAALAAAIALATDAAATAIGMRRETATRDEAGDRLDAARDILLSNEATHPLWRAIRERRAGGANWPAAVRDAVAEAPDEARAEYDRVRAEIEPLAALPRRPLPALHVLTTQSANMTDGYVRSWLEESMALANVVRACGLDAAVKERMEAYRREIETLGAALIDELGLGVEVDNAMAAEGIPRSAAVRRVIGANCLVQRQVSLLAVLREAAAQSPSAKGARTAPKRPPSDAASASPVDPPAVDAYIREHAAELEAEALADVVRRNEREFEEAVHRSRAADETGDADADASERHALERRVVDANPDFQADLRTFVRFAARKHLLDAWDAAHPEWKLRERLGAWLRRHQRLPFTTARKEVVAEHGLNHLTLDPRYAYRATGGGKRYHLLYTPSRVDLGPRERESVETWAQWVGGRDREAAQVGRRTYGLINKAAKRFNSLAEPEVLKTGENASMASHFAYSNAMALMVNATGRGDMEELGDQMSLREDRTIHPAGEGYGGYCVPKDGLFLAFVLTLSERTKLRQLGIPERWHAAVEELARRVLAARDEFPSELEWEAWAEQLLADEEAMHDVFTLRPGQGSEGEHVPVFQITRLAAVLDELGQPPLQQHRAVVKNMAARWSIHTMIAGAEHVNRFMPYYKAWLTCDALAEARRAEPIVPPHEDAIIVLSAEYKPDTQDGRFSVGMRKFEVFAGTDDHLRASLGAEAGTLAAVMFDGWERTFRARGANDPGLREIAALWNVDLAAAEAQERLRAIFPGYPTPGELRMVSPMGLSTQDVLRYTSDTRIEQVADEVRGLLVAAGLSDDDIQANVATFGPRIERWAKLRGRPETAALARKIGGRIHALVLATLGPDRSYEHALQGADVFDVGIPHRQVMRLLDEPARLVELMRYGRPHAALIIADGASGARRRAVTRLGVMRWFAATERIGRRGSYRAIGLGEATVEEWRSEMRARRDRAERLRERLRAGDRPAVEALVRRVVAELCDEQEALLALEEEERLVRFERDTTRDHTIAHLVTEVARAASPASLDFAQWLALGGLFLHDGCDEAELDRAEAEFTAAHERTFSVAGGGGRSSAELRELARKIVVPARRSFAASFRQEGGVESSNKATEEVTRIALDTRRQLAERARRMLALRKRADAFEEQIRQPRRETSATSLVEAIRAGLGTPEEFNSDEASGRVLALVRLLADRLVALRCGEGAEANEIARRFHALLAGRALDAEALRQVSGGYEDIGAVGSLGQTVHERALPEGWSDARRRAALEEVADLAEFIDVARALDVTLADRGRRPDDVDAAALWRRLASFFAETINDHFYEYRPWAYARGTGFDEYQGDELYALADRHHRWLYRYLRHLIATRTEMRHLLEAQQDLLIGRLTDTEVVPAIGAAGVSEPERRWRAYNQLREIAFLRNDGFPLPPVFNQFDPTLIDADNRVNILAMYPVGRTHVSRLLAEGPTLARELIIDGQRAVNILLTRLPRVEGRHLAVDDGHFYVDYDTYVAALRKHWGLSESDAEAIARRDIGPKGIRVAARFSRPVRIALVLPMHGSPMYDEGHLERLGLPYGVQSLFHTWTTYDKAKYPEIFAPETGVKIPNEIDWLAAWTREADDEEAALAKIRDGQPGTSFVGLAAFAQRHRVVMIKDAAESGGRNAKAFELRAATGEIIEDALREACQFLHQISFHHNVAVQEVIISSPETWATEEFLERFADRQITEWHRPIVRDRRPQTPIFGSLRAILSTDRPQAADRVRHWHISHRITLNSTQLITNVGRGGTLDILRPADVRPEFRSAIMEALDDAGRATMEAMAAYEKKAGKRYEDQTGRPVGHDLTGVSYGVPRYLMLDFLLRPIFERPGEVVEIVPDVDAEGRRTGSHFLLHDGAESFVGKIIGWDAILIEPNIGIGLWDRVAIREEEHARRHAEETGEPMDWDRVGENARIVLRDLTRAGADYLAMLGRHDDE